MYAGIAGANSCDKKSYAIIAANHVMSGLIRDPQLLFEVMNISPASFEIIIVNDVDLQRNIGFDAFDDYFRRKQ